MAQNPRADVTPTRWIGVVAGLNIASICVAALLLILTFQWIDGRAPAGFIFAVPLLVGQALLGVLPAVLCVRRARLVGRERRRLLALSIAGPVISASAAVLSLLTFGGC